MLIWRTLLSLLGGYRFVKGEKLREIGIVLDRLVASDDLCLCRAIRTTIVESCNFPWFILVLPPVHVLPEWDVYIILERDSAKGRCTNYGRFANESFRQRLVRQRLRSIRQRPKSFRQRPKSFRQRLTGQFANDRYKVLTKKKAAYWCLECNPVVLG